MDDLSFKFQGFHPSDFTRSYLKDKMSVLLDEAPYGASLQATFTSQNHFYKGVLTIYSSAGKFFAVSSDKKLKDVSDHLISQIREQLELWKTQRFQEKLSANDRNKRQEVPYETDGVA